MRYEDLSFDGDMRDIAVSFAKIARDLRFRPRISVEEGVVELRDALRMGLIKDASESRYRNVASILT